MRTFLFPLGCLLLFANSVWAEPKDVKKKLPEAGKVQWRVLSWQPQDLLFRLVDVEVEKDAVVFVLEDFAVSTPVDNLNLKRKFFDEYSFRDARGTVLSKGMLDYDFGGAKSVGPGSKIRATLKLPAEDVWKKTKMVVVGAK